MAPRIFFHLLSLYFLTPVTDLYMPSVICERFASAFGLISDDADLNLGSFAISSSVHQQLCGLNPLITFTLADPIEPLTSVDIVLGYKSLDFAFGNELDVRNNIPFPVRDIGSASNGSFGRRFFQET